MVCRQNCEKVNWWRTEGRKDWLSDNVRSRDATASKNRKKRILKILEVAKVSTKEYRAAVQEQTRKRVSIILARDIDEKYISNYNPEWLRAWNANLDFQMSFDFFTVIIYVTEYFTKDESGTSAFLGLAAKNCQDLALKDQKRLLTNIFLTHGKIRSLHEYLTREEAKRF